MVAKSRSSGVLCHITALPNRYGVGDCGPEAKQFIDILIRCGQSAWQVLPLGPPDVGGEHINCPYMSCSAFALHPLLISPDSLRKKGYVTEEELTELKKSITAGEKSADTSLNGNKVDFATVYPARMELYKKAFVRFLSSRRDNDALRAEFDAYCAANKDWLDDYCAFSWLEMENGKNHSWLEEREKKSTLENVVKNQDLDYQKFLQFEAESHYREIKEYANSQNVQIFGDVPIYVGRNSADCLAHPEIFQLDKDTGKPKFVSGVPPDYFSETGQLWGHPVFDWANLETNDFSWWVARMQRMLSLYDIVRIDHFAGLDCYWRVPYEHAVTVKTALVGEWCKAPGTALLHTLSRELGWPDAAKETTVVGEKRPFTETQGCRTKHLGFWPPIVAEDLGDITEDVYRLLRKFELPGMKVLQFAFGGDAQNMHLPHNLTEGNVIFTGTHDNNTSMGWWDEASQEQRDHVLKYTGAKEFTSWTMIRAAMNSVARMCVTPVQDIAELNAGARFNHPGKGNNTDDWSWQLPSFAMLTEAQLDLLKELTSLSGRLPSDGGKAESSENTERQRKNSRSERSP